MKQVLENWTIGNVLVGKAIILYLVDENGFVRFAIEEAIEEDPSGKSAGCDYRRLDIPFFKQLRTDKKLGHPALVGCGGARIAGQIMFQPADDAGRTPHWTIDAWSGRYGRNNETAGRESCHVEQVIAEFGRYKIELQNAFEPLTKTA